MLTAERAAELAAELLHAIAQEPRPAGSDAERRARALCAAHLRAHGFTTTEREFAYSAFPGRWATPVVGVVALLVLAVAARQGSGGAPATALVLLVVSAVVLGLIARALAREGVLSFPALRARGVNLEAVRGGDVPNVWLVAHIDSKSQPVPILARAAGITLLAGAWLAAIVVAVIALAAGDPVANDSTARLTGVWTVLLVVGAIGALPVIATTVGARSPGALDNASGVVTVLLAAAATEAAPLGVLIPSAEELGLAGARAWAKEWRASRAPGVAINCDGVDDSGATTCMYTGGRPRGLVAAIERASAATEASVRVHRLLPGILTDGVALADAGWEVVTLSRGGVRTLARIHTPADDLSALAGRGAAEVAAVMARAVEAIQARPSESGAGRGA